MPGPPGTMVVAGIELSAEALRATGVSHDDFAARPAGATGAPGVPGTPGAPEVPGASGAAGVTRVAGVLGALDVRFVREPRHEGPPRWTVDLDGLEVPIFETPEGFVVADAGPDTNRLILRMLLAHRLEPSGGVVMHASAVIRDGQAWLFAGRSGVGKSTLARNSGARLLSDDTVVLRPGPEGILAEGTPFSSAAGQTGAPLAAPVGGLALLGQSAEVEARRLAPREALPGILSNVFFTPRTTGPSVEVSRTLLDLLAQAPACDLRVPLGYVFNPDDVRQAK